MELLTLFFITYVMDGTMALLTSHLQNKVFPQQEGWMLFFLANPVRNVVVSHCADARSTALVFTWQSRVRRSYLYQAPALAPETTTIG